MTRTAQQTEALRQLLRVAQGAPDHLLHMHRVTHAAECGTARCLYGWAMVDPWFRKHTVFGDIPLDFDGGAFPNEIDERAVAHTFGITDAQRVVLFAGDACPWNEDLAHAISKREVTDRIRALLAGRKIKPYRALLETHDRTDASAV